MPEHYRYGNPSVKSVPGAIIYRPGKAMHATGMDVYEIRKRNIKALVERAGGPTAFAKLVGREQPQVSQWLGEKAIGGKLARAIEQALGKDHGWLDTLQPLLGPKAPLLSAVREPIPAYGVRVAELEGDTDRDTDIWIENSDVQVHGGPGAYVPEFVQAEGKAVFQLYWFRSKGAKPENVKRVRVRGSSMEPLLYDGDMVVIDTARREVEDEKVYVLWYGGAKVKRLFRTSDGRLRIVSDNPDKDRYPDEFVSGDDLESVYIVGRVIDKSGSGGLG